MLDPHEYALNRARTTPREFVWKAGADESWKQGLRERLRKVVGLPEPTGVPLDIESTDHRDMGDYVRETLTYTTQPGLRMFAYLLKPKGVPGPGPAVICVPGHGEGVDALVGEAPEDYQNQFAVQCVRAGFVTLAIEPISFGHRKSGVDSDKGSSCSRDSMAALMLGQTMIGWRCFDSMVSFDVLAARPEVDPKRIAIMGISGGGLVAFWTACLDERLAAGVVSGYFNTFFDSILNIDHCVDNYAPGLATLVEMPDMAALVSPRRLFVESGTQDPWFPDHAFVSACQVAEAIFLAEGVPDAFGKQLFNGDHIFLGQKALPKLIEWLGAPVE